MQFVEAKGFKIPLVGLGTWALRGRDCARLTEQAIRIGYRHIDTAQMYDNEREVGEGLRASGLARDQAFITTKIWPSHFAPRELERAVKESLARLQLAEVSISCCCTGRTRRSRCARRSAHFARSSGWDLRVISGFRISPSP